MSALDRYLTREILPPFAAGLVFLTQVLVATQLLGQADVLLGAGVSGLDLAVVVVALVPHFLGYVLPVAFLLGAVLGQAVRTMIRSRLEPGMRNYARAYPRTDIVLLEPDAHDPLLQRAHPFGYTQRREVAEHAYQQTRAWLAREEAALGPKLARHGITLRGPVLRDPHRHLLAPRSGARLAPTLARLSGVLDELEATLQPD